jgi:hypothetical protein
MKERFIENGIEYIKIGDYYIPNLTVPQKRYNIGKYGSLHKKFIKEYHNAFYFLLLANGTLLAYLEKIDAKAKNEVERLIAELAIKQGVTERLKATDQMKWVGMMNNIKAQAEEIVYSTTVYKR